MRVAIIKYNAGNVQSVAFALERLGINYIITDDLEQIQSADKVIFPGVGEASSTMQYLKSKKLDTTIKNLQQPVLGICLGMQLMCHYSEENATDCLGIFDEDVLRFTSLPERKVPHMGWNQLQVRKQLPVENYWLDGSFENQDVYFVHSFYVPVCKYTSAVTEYGIPFSAAMKKDNFYAVQFHPEKSADIGSRILETFLSL
jgi:imidazole glycerol-phosphate synthase subunit HisH